MRTKEEIIAEIRRVAKALGANLLASRDFKKHGQISLSGVKYHFGTWNEAVVAAGLEPNSNTKPKKKPKYSDAQLQEALINLTKTLRKKPSDTDMSSKGPYSSAVYVKRWGTWVKAREAAYAALGLPDID